MEKFLGKWAVIDIETTGIDPENDHIIDLGFLQFEGTVLKKSYSSLVHYDGEISQYIQKLTGIQPELLINAPKWKEIRPILLELQGHVLLAHNAKFEEGFLAKEFTHPDPELAVTFADSLTFLGSIFPDRGHLSLESFIRDFQIADKECHRGFQDSLDLLKVIILSLKKISLNSKRRMELMAVLTRHQLTQVWPFCFLQLTDEDWKDLSQQIEFEVEESFENYQQHLLKLPTVLSSIPATTTTTKRKVSWEFSGKNIQQILRDEEKIQQKIPRYRYREVQESLALRVGQSFKNEVHSLIQAPTGTGKTLGHLLPAALFCLSESGENKKVLVATGTKNLQNQALGQDIPQVRNILEAGAEDLKVIRLIGSSNHLCELQFRKALEETDLFSTQASFEERFAKAYLELVFFHNQQIATQQSKKASGEYLTRDDLAFVLKKSNKHLASLEKEVAVDYRSCLNHLCPFQNQCSYIQGLRQAKDADIIIGNHALMFSWPKGFPRPEYVIVDEAHRIESEATTAFTLSVTQEDLQSLQKSLETSQGPGALYYLLSQEDTGGGHEIPHLREVVRLAAGRIMELSSELPLQMELFFKRRRYYTPLYWNESPMVTKVSGVAQRESLENTIFMQLDSLYHTLKNLSETFTPYLGRWDEKSFKTLQNGDADHQGDRENKMMSFARFQSFMIQIEDIMVVLEEVLKTSSESSHSLKFHAEFGYAIESAPIDVGKKVHQGLLATSQSVVFVSATLGAQTGSQRMEGIEWPVGHLYLESKKRFRQGLFLPPIFDYKNKAKVFLCEDTKDLNDPQFVSTTLSPIIPLVQSLGGRSLFLFSARTRFEEAREILIKSFEGKIPLFIQGMGNSLVEDFKNSPQGILLGMEALGEGIDIPGDSLQFIFIDKIPDLRMDLVIQERRNFFEKTFGQEFTGYFLAHRTRGLQQKLGRLLRTERDHGGVIVVDSRVKSWKGKTFESFTQLMAPYEIQRVPLQQACQEVLDFIMTK